MILVCGVLADGMTELMCARLEDLGYEYLFLDQAQFPGRYDLSWELGPDGLRGRIESPGGAVDLADLTGAYARYVSYKGGPERPEFSEHEKQLVDAEYQLSLMQLLELLPCTVVNRAGASVSNDSKVYQGFLAQQFGLLTPETLVTTDPDAARAFYEAHHGEVIYKSLSGVRSIVRRLTEEDLGERLERVRNCPTQFQERVEGVDLRVHTVGDKVFATEIRSDAHDYRYARREGADLSLEETEIPDAVAQSCLGLARSLGLHLSGVDLRRTPEGRYYCFEINPSPGFIFYERATGQSISEAVAHLLRGTPG
ncbi:MAG: glutathione synthase [Armatimonadetes bacterium]|nr:glutathione synthase [Armatimonadota bacterium]